MKTHQPETHTSLSLKTIVHYMEGFYGQLKSGHLRSFDQDKQYQMVTDLQWVILSLRTGHAFLLVNIPALILLTK